MIMSSPYNPPVGPAIPEVEWQVDYNLFTAILRKNKLRKIFNLPDEEIPF